MNESSRFPAVVAYLIPVLGWLYVYLFQRKNPLALYHLRQSIGLFVVMILTFAAWAVVAWLLAWIPLMVAVSASLFTVVMVFYVYGILAWIMGMVNAANNQQVPLPGFGNWASRLPIK